MPRIIGASVKLNALVSILAVLVGGALCGVGGMFLSLPFVAICKVIFDHVEELKPWAMLLGDEDDARWTKLGRRKPVKKQRLLPDPCRCSPENDFACLKRSSFNDQHKNYFAYENV